MIRTYKGTLLALLALTAACKTAEPETVVEVETVTNTITEPVTNTVTITNEVEVPVTNTITKTNTITNTITNTNTNTVTDIVTVVDEDLDPGQFSKPIVWNQRVQNGGGAYPVGSTSVGSNHMHLSEMVYREAIPDTDGVDATSNAAYAMLVQCSYYFGFYKADNPASMSVSAQGWTHAKTTGTKAPGCIHLALDDDDRELVFTTHHGGITDGLGFLSGWDLNLVNSTTDSNLDGIVDSPTSLTTAPAEIPKLTEPGVAYEGLDVENGIIWVTLHDEGLGMFTYDKVANLFTRVGSYDVGLENSWDIVVNGDLAFLADGIGGLVTLNVSNPLSPVELDRVVFEGTARDIMINGNYAYVAAESGGVAVIDITDPSDTFLVNTIDTGSGGAIALDYDNGKLFVAAWNDARVYDTSVDPAFPTIIGAVRATVAKEYSVETEGEPRPDITDRVLAIAGKDNFLMNGTWWVPNNYEVFPEYTAPYIELPTTMAQMTFAGDLNFGESSTFDILIRNAGNETLTIYDVWSTNPAFSPSTTEMQILPGGSQTLTMTFTASIGVDGAPAGDTGTFDAAESAILNIVSDDPSQPIRQGYMEGNIDSLGVGDAFPETLVTLNDGSDWSFTNDALGSVTLIAYFATF